MRRSVQAPGPNGVRWFEVDFPEVTRRKAAIIAGNEPLRKLLGPVESQNIHLGAQLPGFPAAAFVVDHPSYLSTRSAVVYRVVGGRPLLFPISPQMMAAFQNWRCHLVHGREAWYGAVLRWLLKSHSALELLRLRACQSCADEGRITAGAYSLLPGDLRDTRACQAALEAAGFDPACPTYVLAECVLVYMEPEDSASVVRWLGHWLPTAAFVVYEQVSNWLVPGGV